jgi:hypothetical integral membrane protein (TIGR02206 family)
MQSDFRLFGPAHLGILASIPVIATLLAWPARRNPASGHYIQLGVAIFLVANTVGWYGYLLVNGWVEFPDTLPLELCDVTLYLILIALFTARPVPFDLAYYGALGGSMMALLTPDLWEPFPSYGTVQFFVAHGFVVIAVLFLVLAGRARPRPGSAVLAFVALNGYAAFVGVFNLVFGTNYMYLREKPANPSLLDYLGPWPWYILTSEVVALVVFGLLYMPFRSRSVRLL